MKILDKVKDTGRSITGSPKKALLIFPFATDVMEQASPKKKSTKGIPDLTRQVLNNDPERVDLLPNFSWYLEVQYNPESIRYNATAHPVTISSLQNSLEPNALNPQVTRPESVTMQVDLVFNDVNVKDAFIADKMRLSANDIITDTAAAAKNAKGGYTVQPQSNGLVAATFIKNNRRVIFQWADASFCGDIEEVYVKYTMFSVYGRPIHSVVTLRIVQVIDKSSEADYLSRKKFDACFNNNQNRSIRQATGNLLNISGI